MFELLTITELIGRFHPVLVHLPIGILLLAVLFYLLSYKKGFETLQPAIKISLLLGTLAAIASCISGWLLSNSGDYDEALVTMHQWLGIGAAVASALTYFLLMVKPVWVKWLMPVMASLIIITGHLGGSLTHGEDYLSLEFSSGKKNNIAGKPIPGIQQAVVYDDIVQPLLQSKCYSCHGPAKQKGKLRLDAPSFINQGGEEGKVLIAGNAGESELIKRMLLPLDNKDHMPPKQKPQLTKAEIELLTWWVSAGADYHKRTAELNQPVEIKILLAALQSGSDVNEMSASDVPEEKVERAPDDVIKKLTELNVAVNNISQSSNYLSVNFVAVDSVTALHASLLQQIGKQTAWLKLGNTKISDSVMHIVGKLPLLTKLFLNSSNATDKSMQYINGLLKLQYLNVSSTAITAKGVSSLNGLKNLRRLYLYKTGVTRESLVNLKKIFPAALIDTGGYNVQFLPTDTMIVKEKLKKG